MGAAFDGIAAANSDECRDAGGGYAVRRAAQKLGGERANGTTGRDFLTAGRTLKARSKFCVTAVKSNALPVLRYRKGMFGKRGEIPPLPRNCDARTWKPKTKALGLGIYR